MDQSGTSHPSGLQSPPLNDSIEIMLLRFLTGGENNRVQNLDMSTLDSSGPWEIQALREASLTQLASLMPPFRDL